MELCTQEDAQVSYVDKIEGGYKLTLHNPTHGRCENSLSALKVVEIKSKIDCNESTSYIKNDTCLLVPDGAIRLKEYDLVKDYKKSLNTSCYSAEHSGCSQMEGWIRQVKGIVTVYT